MSIHHPISSSRFKTKWRKNIYYNTAWYQKKSELNEAICQPIRESEKKMNRKGWKGGKLSGCKRWH